MPEKLEENFGGLGEVQQEVDSNEKKTAILNEAKETIEQFRRSTIMGKAEWLHQVRDLARIRREKLDPEGNWYSTGKDIMDFYKGSSPEDLELYADTVEEGLRLTPEEIETDAEEWVERIAQRLRRELDADGLRWHKKYSSDEYKEFTGLVFKKLGLSQEK